MYLLKNDIDVAFQKGCNVLIVWINGTYKGEKTTVAKALKEMFI